jgi:ankyrin repeat protein
MFEMTIFNLEQDQVKKVKDSLDTSCSFEYPKEESFGGEKRIVGYIKNEEKDVLFRTRIDLMREGFVLSPIRGHKKTEETALAFDSTSKALQYLSDISGKKIKIASIEEDKEYRESLMNYYKGDSELVDMILQGEDSAKMQFNSDIQTRKSDSGNLIVRFIEKGHNLGILGIISKKGKVIKEDVNNLKSWINELVDKIEKGYNIYTSANEISKAILEKTIKLAEQKGIKVKIQKAGGFEYKGMKWDNMMINKTASIKFSSTSKALQYLSDYTGNKIIIAGIKESWATYLEKVLKSKNIENQNTLNKLKELFLEFEKDNDDALKVISKYVKNLNLKNISEGHIVDHIKKELKDIFLQRKPQEERRAKKIQEALDILEKNEVKEPNLQEIAEDIVDNNKDIYKEIVKYKHTSTVSTKKLLDSKGQYKLYEINNFDTDGALEKHLNTDELEPVHIDMKKTGWCVRFQDYFDEYEKPIHLITKNNKPYILLHEESKQIMDINNDDFIELDKDNFYLINQVYKYTLNYAINTKDKEIIKLVLDVGAKPNNSENNNTLNKAIEYTKDKEIIKQLLDAGAKPDNSEGYKNTLNKAIEHTKDKEIIKQLLDAGAKPDNSEGYKNTLNRAIEYTQDKEIIKQLIDAGAKPNEYTLAWVIDTNDKGIIKWVLDAGAKPNEYTLAWAIEEQDKEKIKQLLDAGAKPNPDTLNYAIDTNDKEIIKLVLETYKKYNIEIPEKDLQKANEILEIEPVLAFDSTSKAIQFLSDYTNKKVIILL